MVEMGGVAGIGALTFSSIGESVPSAVGISLGVTEEEIFLSIVGLRFGVLEEK